MKQQLCVTLTCDSRSEGYVRELFRGRVVVGTYDHANVCCPAKLNNKTGVLEEWSLVLEPDIAHSMYFVQRAWPVPEMSVNGLLKLDKGLRYYLNKGDVLHLPNKRELHIVEYGLYQDLSEPE